MTVYRSKAQVRLIENSTIPVVCFETANITLSQVCLGPPYIQKTGGKKKGKKIKKR